MGTKKDKAEAILIGFDDDSAINLQNPFAKKPVLRGKNISVASSKALLKVEAQKSSSAKSREADQDPSGQGEPIAKQGRTQEEQKKMERMYEERRKENKKQLIEVFFDDNTNNRKEAPAANLAEMFNAKRKVSGLKSAAAVD